MLHVEVSGFLTLCPAVLSLRIAQLRLRRDIDDALIIRVDLDKAAYVTLLYRQLRARATSPNLLSAWARWLQDAVRKPVSARR